MPFPLFRHPFALAFSRLLLAGVFLWSAQSKLRDPRGFTRIVLAYRILPGSVARLYGQALPWLEAALGLWLGLGAASQYAGSIAVLLLASFSFAVALNLLRGRTGLSCGCFGGHQTLGAATLAREGMLLLPALHLALFAAAPATDAIGRLAQALAWRPAPVDWLALALSLAGLGAISGVGRVFLVLKMLGKPVGPASPKEARS